jgi:xanthine dehydrogenase YagS FAD-binding subunit
VNTVTHLPAPEFRAGGTDLTERRRSGVSTGPVVDIGHRPELSRLQRADDGGLRIGALVTLAQVAADAEVRAGYPGLAAAAGGLATPQIRRVATVGGSLLQRNRCWYYRNPHTDCVKKTGTHCPARDGNHLYHVVFDLGPCVAPHPSTVGAALLAHDATVKVVGTGEGATVRRLPVAEVFGDGRDGRHDHTLAPDDLLVGVRLPAPAAGERAAYFRAISRAYAEWPLVEAVVRLVVDDGVVSLAAVAVGGVAPVPLRLPAVEAALRGRPVTAEVLDAAAGHAADGATPLPMTGYKVPLLTGTVRHTLGLAAGLSDG